MTGATAWLGRIGQVRIRLAGIDVEIQLVFVAWLAILALASGRNDLALVTWVVVAGLAVLITNSGTPSPIVRSASNRGSSSRRSSG